MKKVPDDLLKQIILLVMKKKKKVETQEELEKLVKKYLKRLDPEFVVSPKKIRFLALSLPQIETRVETKSTSKKPPKKCPACGGNLSYFHAVNLKNEKVVVAFECKCGYAGTTTSFTPAQYHFMYKPK